jgi:hypothetical protein
MLHTNSLQYIMCIGGGGTHYKHLVLLKSALTRRVLRANYSSLNFYINKLKTCN